MNRVLTIDARIGVTMSKGALNERIARLVTA